MERGRSEEIAEALGADIVIPLEFPSGGLTLMEMVALKQWWVERQQGIHGPLRDPE